MQYTLPQNKEWIDSGLAAHAQCPQGMGISATDLVKCLGELRKDAVGALPCLTSRVFNSYF